MSKKGANNHIIADYFSRGMKVTGGQVVLPGGTNATIKCHKKGYAMVVLDRCNFTVARLACWQAYGPPPFSGAVTDHIDRDVTNDRPSNLRWATCAENAANITEKARLNRIANGKRVGETRTIWQRRETNSPLSVKQVIEIKSMRGLGLPQHEIASQFGVSQITISRIWREFTWAGVGKEQVA